MNRRGVLAAYYAAHVAKSLLWTASDLATIYVLVDRYHMGPAAAGWLFLIGLVANAVADWCVGRWLDRRTRDAPALAAGGLVVAAVAFPATMLATPAGGAALLAATLAFRLGYAAYDVPHNALLSRLATTAAASTRLARGRTLCTGVAAALIGAGFQLASGGAALPWLLWTVAGVAVAGGLLLVPLLRRLPIAAAYHVSGAALPWRFLAGSLVGVVGSGMLGKAILHLPEDVPHPGAGAIMIGLTLGRTAAALLPAGFADARRGERLLGALYAGGAVAMLPLFWAGGWSLPLLLGMLMGVTNLVGWAILPLLAGGPRGYGLYTMAGKLALGMAGFGMTVVLGTRPSFDDPGLGTLVIGAATASILAALLLWRPGIAKGQRQRAGMA